LEPSRRITTNAAPSGAGFGHNLIALAASLCQALPASVGDLLASHQHSRGQHSGGGTYQIIRSEIDKRESIDFAEETTTNSKESNYVKKNK
jgi:hypothetical protein